MNYHRVIARSTFLVASLLALLLPLFGPAPLSAAASPSSRLYLVGGGHVMAFDTLTLSPLPARGDRIAASTLTAPRSSQLLQSPDGATLAVLRPAPHATLTILDARTGRTIRTEGVSNLTLLGVANDGREWFGFEAMPGGTTVRFVDARGGTRRILPLQVPHRCCVLLQYDRALDRLYAFTLRTAWGRNPDPPVITAWQVGTHRRLATLTIRGMVAGTWYMSTSHASSPAGNQRVIPGFSLSPSGRLLIVLDYVDHRLDTIDPMTLRWLHNPFIRGPLDTFSTSGPAIVPSARLSGNEGDDITTQFSPDGKTIYQQGVSNVDFKSPFVFSEALPVEAIDVARSTVRGVIRTPLLAPLRVGIDGKSVYTVIAQSRGGRVIVLLQRRDPTTLSVVRQRAIPLSLREYELLDLAG